MLALLLLAALADPTSLREGERLWRMKHTRSAILAFEKAARAPESASEAHYRLGRIYYFKGWQAEGAFPGWHEEIAYREKALAAFDAALSAKPVYEPARLWRAKAAGAGPVEDPATDLEAQQIRELDAAQSKGDMPAIEARLTARPDPAAFVAAANLLLQKGAYAEARLIAQRLVPAAETFVEENLGSYKLAEKARGSLQRTRATAAELEGWALFQEGELQAAEAKLLEAERLYRGQDFTNQVRLAELLAKKGAQADAREHYLNALSLSGGAAAQRAAAKRALAELRAAEGFDAWLDADLARRREERRARMLSSLQDRPLPALPLLSLSGEPFDASKLRGKVLLYKFFASW